VVIAGTNLGATGTTLTLNGQAITAFTNTATQISFNVPAGATTGSLVVTTPNGKVSSSFTVTLPTTTFDLQIQNVELTQSTQTLDNSIPIVAGRAGLIRVFVVANQANTAAPAVRITLMNNKVPVNGYPKIVAAPSASAPTAVNEGSLTASWNLTVPATDLTTPTGTGYSVLAEVDPTGAVAEADKTNNSFTAVLNSTTVPIFKTTIFPVVLSTGTGNISETNKAQWVARLAKMFPIASVDVAVGAAFTPSITTLTSATTGNGWDTLLSDLTAKHVADAVTDRYYYGAATVSYGSGTAGLGWVPTSSSSSYQYRTAIGWDKFTGNYADGGLAPEVFAHETGHNMGRSHSPCGVTSSDPNYPSTSEYLINGTGGGIGKWGYDTVLNVLHSPLTDKDIMGYCSPNWVSDYTYKGILSFRAATGGFLVVSAEDAPLPAPLTVVQECLIVRGIVHDDASVEMLPSFRTQALPSALPSSGDYTLECQDAQGRTTFTTPLELMELGCSPAEHVRHFVMALPLDASVMNSLAGLKLLQAGQAKASLRSATGMARVVTMAPNARRMSEDKLQVTWDASVHGTAMVRDADTGEVIAILSGGQQTISAKAKHVDLVLSDGVTGATHRLEPAN
jgi:hypothetical protein